MDSINYKKGCTRLAAASDQVYQLLAHGWWFSLGTTASSTTKTGRHDIAEILLKVALNTINQIKYTFSLHTEFRFKINHKPIGNWYIWQPQSTTTSSNGLITLISTDQHVTFPCVFSSPVWAIAVTWHPSSV